MLAYGPDITPMGPSVTAEAERAGITPELLGAHMLKAITPVNLLEKTRAERVVFMPGHVAHGGLGPQPAKVMAVGKMPWKDELHAGRLFAGASGKLLRQTLDQIGVPCNEWYLTNVCRFKPPGFTKSIKKGWIKECMWFFDQELEIVKPEFLLLMGADAVRAVMGRIMKVNTLSSLQGATNLEYRGVKVWAVNHPAAVCAEPALHTKFQSDLATFGRWVGGDNIDVSVKTDYRPIDNEKDLEDLVNSYLARGINRFAVDCEWGGDKGSDYLTGKLRTIQISHTPHFGACIILYREGMK
jgi:DNA polymerase